MANLRSYSCGVLLAIYLAGSGPGFAQTPSTNTNAATFNPVSDFVTGMVSNGNRYLDNGQLDDALASVDSALQMDPHSAEAYALRGSVYRPTRLPDSA